VACFDFLAVALGELLSYVNLRFGVCVNGPLFKTGLAHW
jgi:hypothetical protein